MSFIIFLIFILGDYAFAGSTSRCGKGPIRDFGDFGTTYADIYCVFQNVCWHQKSLLFNLTGSAIVGPWPIVISASSVPHHDGLTLDITPVSKQTLDGILASSNVVFTENAILLQRFLPDNLFHALHDDILPAYAMKEALSHLNLTLFFADSEKQTFHDYYKLLRLSLAFTQPSKVRCFRTLFTGLPKDTLWYHYGFRTPQSTLLNPKVSIIRKFVHEVRIDAGAEVPRKCTILIRRSNRLILNQRELKHFLVENHRCRAEVVSLETNSEKLREVLSVTDLLISMHGAELSLMIFLPANALVIELFPYGINSSNHTPYQELCELLGLIYEPWENKFEANNVAFPELWLSGLPERERREILAARFVKPHLCCTDAAWLFRIYQDTRIDIDSLREVIRKAKSKRSLHLNSLQVNYFERPGDFAPSPSGKQADSASASEWQSFWTHLIEQLPNNSPAFYYGRVRDIRCIQGTNDRKFVSWRAPINTKDAPRNESYYFEVLSQCGYEARMTRTTKTSFMSAPCIRDLIVWVHAHNGLKTTHPVRCTH